MPICLCTSWMWRNCLHRAIRKFLDTENQTRIQYWCLFACVPLGCGKRSYFHSLWNAERSVEIENDDNISKIRKCWNVKSSPSAWCVCATHYQSASPGRVCHILSLITFWKLRNRNWEETIHWNFKQSVWRSGFIGDSFMIVGDGDGCMLWCRMLWWEIQLYKLQFKQNVILDFFFKSIFQSWY